MQIVPVSRLSRTLGQLNEVAAQEPIEITSHGRSLGYFVPTETYQEFVRLKASSRRVRLVTDHSREEIDRIASGRMDPRHDHLNALMDEA